MIKRWLALALALASVLTLAIYPSAASAQTLSGWTSKVDYDNTDPNRYSIEIDVTNQIITVYNGAIGGSIVLQSLCTTGDAEHSTNRGTYRVGDLKERFGYFVAFGQYAQYWTQVVRGIYIHSLMYDSKKLTTMSKSAYRNLGKNVSHGCVRVLPDIAKWIFYNCPPGTLCKVTKKAADPELVKRIKAGIPAYSSYVQPTDAKADPPEIPGVVRFDKTPIRTGSSSTNDKTIGTLKAGTKLVLLQISEDWCKVRTYTGQIGYVKSKYIIAYPDAAVDTVKGYAASGKTYVYTSASTKSKTLIRIPSGAMVTLTRRVSDAWWYGTYDGVTGYIRSKYVKSVTDYVYPTLSDAGSSNASPTPTKEPSLSGGGLLGGGSSSSGSGYVPSTGSQGGTASSGSVLFGH